MADNDNPANDIFNLIDVIWVLPAIFNDEELTEAIMRSTHDWLSVEDLTLIFENRAVLPVTRAMVPMFEGLFLVYESRFADTNALIALPGNRFTSSLIIGNRNHGNFFNATRATTQPDNHGLQLVRLVIRRRINYQMETLVHYRPL